MNKRFWLATSLGTILGMVASGHVRAADTVQQRLADSSCAALHTAATAIPGDGPMLLPSYPDPGRENGKLRALRDVAFVYDNALAGIALVACGRPRQARRIADALLLAAAHDPHFHDGRLRNAYRAGAVNGGQVELPGFWDEKHQLWSQDASQVSTATGNVAWAALLQLTVYDSSHDPRYLHAAVAQLHWIQAHTLDKTAPAAYVGGIYGYADAQQVQHWKSTEHNIDVHAAAAWAARRLHDDPTLSRLAATAGRFVTAMWDPTGPRFFIGTLDDGRTISRDRSGLDAQVWPLLAFAAHPAAWDRIWSWVGTQYRSGAGYGYRRQPDGIWTEGTAQVAAALQASGRTVPEGVWQLLAAQRSDDGMLYATPQSRISTGLAIGPDSTSADFFYYHLPHLGATAWAALAGRGWNPFTGKPLRTEG